MFEKLKNLFVIPEENTSNNNAPEATKQATDQEKISQDTPVSVTANKPLSGEPDQKFLNILMGAIEKQNQEGFDYLEFKQSLQNLKGVVPDESTRYNSTIAMAKTMGATKDTIVKSASLYLNVLKNEESKFSETVVSQKQRLSAEQTNGVADIKNDIALKKKQIEQLKSEVTALESKLLQSEEEIKNQANKIQTTSDQFMLAYQAIVNQITSDINNLNKYVTQ